MKIAFVLSKCHKFGSSRYIVEISRYFSEWGHEVHVFANTCDSLPWIKFHKIPTFSSNYLLREGITTFLETFILKKYNFDVTAAQPARYFTPDICHVRFLTKAAHKKVGYKENLSSKVSSAIEEYNLKKCKKIIAMSNTVKNEIIKYYKIPEEKISVVYDGVNIKEFNPKNKKKYGKEIRERFGLSETDTVLLFVGNPFSRKGLEYAIRALLLIKEKVKLLVIGKDDILPYQNLAEKLGIENQLIYAGFTKEINKYFATSDIFVFPTLYEPFGLVILEAMASGLPVVTSAEAGAAELIKNEKEGLLLENPKNPKEIAEKVNFLVDNDLIEKIGKNARKKIEKYTWERTAKEMEKVFKEIKR